MGDFELGGRCDGLAGRPEVRGDGGVERVLERRGTPVEPAGRPAGAERGEPAGAVLGPAGVGAEVRAPVGGTPTGVRVTLRPSRARSDVVEEVARSG